MQVTTIGIDLAKHVFQVHGVDAQGRTLLRKRLRRPEVAGFFAGLPPCLVGMEACAMAHHWARELRRLGHEVRLMPPAYVKPYVKRGKTDAADAEAICEAVARPSMRFVPTKTAEQQAALVLHRTPGMAAPLLGDAPVPRRPLAGLAHRGVQAEVGDQLLGRAEAGDVADRRRQADRDHHIDAGHGRQAPHAPVLQRVLGDVALDRAQVPEQPIQRPDVPFDGQPLVLGQRLGGQPARPLAPKRSACGQRG